MPKIIGCYEDVTTQDVYSKELSCWMRTETRVTKWLHSTKGWRCSRPRRTAWRVSFRESRTGVRRETVRV